jgi:hypothetical protein
MEWYRFNTRAKLLIQVDCKTNVLLLTHHSLKVEGGTVIFPFINPDGDVFGSDKRQGWWERNMTLGTFTIDIDPITITYTSDCQNGKRNYEWKTKVFIIDNPGLQPHDGLKYKFFVGILGIFESGRRKLAEWDLSGSASCSCCKDNRKGNRRSAK